MRYSYVVLKLEVEVPMAARCQTIFPSQAAARLIVHRKLQRSPGISEKINIFGRSEGFLKCLGYSSWPATTWGRQLSKAVPMDPCIRPFPSKSEGEASTVLVLACGKPNQTAMPWIEGWDPKGNHLTIPQLEKPLSLLKQKILHQWRVWPWIW